MKRIWLLRVIEGTALTIVISIVFYGLGFMGLAFAGAGHGSIFFGKMIAAPLSVSSETGIPLFMDTDIPFLPEFSLWPVVGALLAFRRILACRITAEALLGIHYIGIVLLCSVTTDWGYVRRIDGMIPPYLAIYVGMQVFMWTLIVRASDARRRNMSMRPVS